MNVRAAVATLLVILVVTLIAGGLFIYYAAVYTPAQLHAQATATTVAGVATGTAQVVATSRAQTSATASASAQAASVAVATAVALGDLYVRETSGNAVINDSLRGQSSNNWAVEQQGGSSCGFADGLYHVKAQAGYVENCNAKATNFRDLAFQIELSIISGHSGGICIRADNNGSGYFFRISTDGTYWGKSVQVRQNTAYFTSLFAGHSSAVKTGSHQFNQIAVIAQGSELVMYINQQFVAQISDNTYKSGQIGVYADSDASGSEIVFRNAQVWKL
jgi:hypothetical protein